MNLPFLRFPTLLLIVGFISLKRDLRELNIAEIPVEPRVRSNLIPGRADERTRVGCALHTSPSRFALSATTPRIYLPYPLVTVRACVRAGIASRPGRGHRGNEPPSLTIFACVQAPLTICSGRRATGKRRGATRKYGQEVRVREVMSTAVVFAVDGTKCGRYPPRGQLDWPDRKNINNFYLPRGRSPPLSFYRSISMVYLVAFSSSINIWKLSVIC